MLGKCAWWDLNISKNLSALASTIFLLCVCPSPNYFSASTCLLCSRTLPNFVYLLHRNGCHGTANQIYCSRFPFFIPYHLLSCPVSSTYPFQTNVPWMKWETSQRYLLLEFQSNWKEKLALSVMYHAAECRLYNENHHTLHNVVLFIFLGGSSVTA